MRKSTEEQWRAALKQHSDTMRSFIETAAALDESLWLNPVAAGKWSPAEIVEHLRLAYDILLRELNEGRGLRIRTNWFMRQFIRLAILPKILKGKRLPTGVKAPREVRPTQFIADRHEALHQLLALATQFELESTKKRHSQQSYLTHHLFGRLTILKGIQFCAIHVNHHRLQLPAKILPR
jgi:hypothetical protein